MTHLSRRLFLTLPALATIPVGTPSLKGASVPTVARLSPEEVVKRLWDDSSFIVRPEGLTGVGGVYDHFKITTFSRLTQTNGPKFSKFEVGPRTIDLPSYRLLADICRNQSEVVTYIAWMAELKQKPYDLRNQDGRHAFLDYFNQHPKRTSWQKATIQNLNILLDPYQGDDPSTLKAYGAFVLVSRRFAEGVWKVRDSGRPCWDWSEPRAEAV